MVQKKRTDWKGKALQLEREESTLKLKNENLQRQVESQKEEVKKRWSLMTYCANCLVVSSCSAPPEVSIKNLDCLNCRVRGQLSIVREVK